MKIEDQDKEPAAASERGDVFGNITISGGTVGAIGGRGHHIQQSAPAETPATEAPAEPGTPPAEGPDPAAVRDLLLAAFTAADLRRTFAYSDELELRPAAQDFAEGDGLADMVDKGIAFCRTRGLLPALLAEVARLRPRVYARYRDRLSG